VGTEITLDVAGLTLAWSKNSRGQDHGMLFQEKDRQRTPSDQIDYDWFAKNKEDPGPMEIGFCRSLREVLPRIELLGFTLDHVRREYERCVKAYGADRDDANGKKAPPPMSFSEFVAFATAHPLETLDDTYDDDDSRMRGRFSDEALTQRIPRHWDYDMLAYSERSYFGRLIDILSPYAMLRLLAQNPANLEADVAWQYGPLVEAGWATESEFVPEARRRQTFLVATEGSSDAHILKHGFSLLKPEIYDFFRFIDVSERHPFPGTGNLVKFAEGLAKIDVQNQVVFLFDNDAEGLDAYQRVLSLNLPSNMRAMMLPELKQFLAFPARGPDGVKTADINRRAAAIECYLDLESHNDVTAKVIWTTYKKELDAYQGALENKENYAKGFLRQTSQTVGAGTYDVSKLRAVLDALCAECQLIPEEALQAIPWPPNEW
jgi:hypothetical protein